MLRTSLFAVALLGWSSIAAAQPLGEEVKPQEPAPEGAPAPPPGEAVPPSPAMVVQASPPEPVEPPKKIPKISITMAPILLVLPLIELTAEYRVAKKIGVSITVGAGKRTIEGTFGAEANGNEIVAGAQFRYYAIGNFRHGMEVGVQLLEEYVKFEEPLPAGIVGVAAGGFTAGGFLGYKIATQIGFTFEAQLGARYLVVEPAVQGSAMGAFDDTEKWVPLLHLNVGWSF